MPMPVTHFEIRSSLAVLSQLKRTDRGSIDICIHSMGQLDINILRLVCEDIIKSIDTETNHRVNKGLDKPRHSG
jgi:hypothetical protein